MAKTFTLTNAARSAACDAIVDLLDAGGTTADVAIYNTGSATLLVACPLGTADAFGAASNGVASMTTATATGTAVASGTAAQFQLRNGADAEVAHGNVGTTGTSFTMAITNTSINTSDVVQITAMTVTVPAS